jgi:serine O-acetyltransferase
VAENTAMHPDAEWTISPPTAWDTSSLRGLRAVVREDREARGSSWHLPGLQALVVHRFGEWGSSDGCPRLLRRPATMLYYSLRGYIRNVLGIEIGKSARLGRRVKFYHQHGVVIEGRVTIGDDCVFHHGVTLATNFRPDSPTSLYHSPQVGSGVTFGAGCVVLGGVRIGDGATIGPNAVVTKDVPPGASAVAQPARILRIR